MKNVYEAILAILDSGMKAVTAEEIQGVRDFAEKGKERQDANEQAKAETAKFYNDLEAVVIRVLGANDEPMTMAQLVPLVTADSACPPDTTRARIQYGISHKWNTVESIRNGRNPNTYTLKKA